MVFYPNSYKGASHKLGMMWYHSPLSATRPMEQTLPRRTRRPVFDDRSLTTDMLQDREW
ncbi:MAG: hypothetical protein JNM19_15890 [Chitinophagaceae bacterium]|nr:hypothetical protein [Chitinophagaceae bacterium]